MRTNGFVLAFLLCARFAAGAVALDANASAPCQAAAVVGTTGSTCATLTVGVGANRAVLCAVAFNLHTPTSEVGVWDSGGTNQAMTQIVAANTTSASGRSELWGLVAPTSGAKTVKFTWVGTSDIYINCTAFTGVNQTGGVTTFPNSTTQTGAFGAVTMPITSAVGNWTFSHICEDLGSISLNTQTLAYIDNALSMGAGAEHATGAASVTHGFTVGTGGSVYAFVGTDVLASGGATPRTRSLLGVGTH